LRDARKTQLIELDRRLAAGRRLVGYKTALLDPSAQQRLGAPGPVWGWFTDDMQLADGASLDCASRHRLRAEAEIVFVLGEDLVGPGVTVNDVLSATSAIRAGIELPGSVRADASTSAADFVADNTAASWFLLGASSVPVTGLDLTELRGALRCDDVVVAAGHGARVLGNPARAVVTLVNSLAQDGRELRAGEFIFTGAVAGPISLVAGHRYTAEFDQLGTVRFTTR
jgi:2-keto-4-pentenoate hydratase